MSELTCHLYDCRGVDTDLYGRILSQLSVERRALAESYAFFSDRVMSAVAGLGMERLAASLGTRMVKLDNGKPIFQRDDMHLNVSHSGGFVALAWSDRPVGVDIQESRPLESVAHLILGLAEDVPYTDNDALLTIWTAKESYVKLTGEGMSKDFRSFNVYRDGELVSDVRGISYRRSRYHGNLEMCVCGDESCPMEIGFISAFELLEDEENRLFE